MSLNIPTHYVQQYSSNIQLLLQQKGSKLRNLVLSGTHAGKQASPVDQFGAVAAQRVTGRFQAMPRVDAPTDRRWVFPVDYDLPQLIDQFDKLRLLTDPQSSYVANGVYAMGRAMDDEIIAAFFGDAKTGENGGTNTPFPASQVVARDFGGASATGLTVAKLREAKRILMAAEVDLDADTITAVVTAKQHDDLLKEAQVVSTDFNDKPVLVDGKVTRFLGINIVHCERLQVDTANADRRIPVFAKSGMYLGIWNDIQTSVSKRNDLRGEPWQAYCLGTFGGTRLEEKKVVEIKCDE